MHSNGFTAARHVIFKPDVEPRTEWKGEYKGKLLPDDRPSILQGKSILDAMLEPTALYTVEAALVGQTFNNRDIYGINITGNGLHNFNRAGENVSFEITDPLPPLSIHLLLVQESKWSNAEAYRKQNMGMGFAYVVPSLDSAEKIVELINQQQENRAKIVGEVRKLPESETTLRTTLHKEGKEIPFVGYTS